MTFQLRKTEDSKPAPNCGSRTRTDGLRGMNPAICHLIYPATHHIKAAGIEPAISRFRRERDTASLHPVLDKGPLGVEPSSCRLTGGRNPGHAKNPLPNHNQTTCRTGGSRTLILARKRRLLCQSSYGPKVDGVRIELTMLARTSGGVTARWTSIGHLPSITTLHIDIGAEGIEPSSHGYQPRIFPLDHAPACSTLHISRAGVEPARPTGHRGLSAACLPFHPPGHHGCTELWNRTRMFRSSGGCMDHHCQLGISAVRTGVEPVSMA